MIYNEISINRIIEGDFSFSFVEWELAERDDILSQRHSDTRETLLISTRLTI